MIQPGLPHAAYFVGLLAILLTYLHVLLGLWYFGLEPEEVMTRLEKNECGASSTTGWATALAMAMAVRGTAEYCWLDRNSLWRSKQFLKP